ncbi:Cfr10I/Bse634I family restriction endonuclease [Peribacillus sp. NPDC097206]|uniref:Cfr10I/Bse634I family restriction endonuclease n=1 Tax=Peribacillus sp. NPDC097206 TaxID=3364398 RepID=UPI003823C279
MSYLPILSSNIPSFVELKNGKVRIKAKTVLDYTYGNTLPSGNFDDILENIIQHVYHSADRLGLPRPTGGGINNSRGMWFEYILGAISWNLFANHPKTQKGGIIKLPSSKGLYFIDLFEPDARMALQTGLFRTLAQKNITMTMSNPDFVAVDDLDPNAVAMLKQPILNLNYANQTRISTASNLIKDQIQYNGIKFGLSAKTSIRPDRRYQTIYEGNILKALVAHLQVRFWDTSSSTGFYVVVADSVNDSDRNVFSAPATHSIVDVHSEPVPSVDGVFLIKTTDQFEHYLNQMIDECYI